MVHPTREGFDQTLNLTPTLAPEFTGSIEKLMPGPRLLDIVPFTGMAASCSNPVARSRPDLSKSASGSVNCYHCELPVLESGWELQLQGQTQHFCCGGCLAVAEHLHTQGLTQYYQIRQAPGIKPDEATVDQQDMALLESRFAKAISADESRIELAVEGITCGGCAWLIEHALDRLDGVSLSLVNLAEHRVRVHYHPSKINLATLIQTLAEAGYRASPWAASEQAIAAKKSVKAI